VLTLQRAPSVQPTVQVPPPAPHDRPPVQPAHFRSQPSGELHVTLQVVPSVQEVRHVSQAGPEQLSPVLVGQV
jgi:hypothetical protein